MDKILDNKINKMTANKEYVMTTDWNDHWSLQKERKVPLQNRQEIVTCRPGETFYTESVLKGISMDKIRSYSEKGTSLSTLFIKVKGNKNRDVESVWKGLVDNIKIEPYVIKFKVHLVESLRNIPEGFEKYIGENGWYEVNNEQKASDVAGW